MSDFKAVTCPFCNEADFDLIGLKTHLLNGWCETFEQTQPVIAEWIGATVEPDSATVKHE